MNSSCRVTDAVAFSRPQRERCARRGESLLATVAVLAIVLLLATGAVRAEVAPVTAYASQTSAWVGQRLSFYIELRARGTFQGTASFDLPRIPRTLLIKIGEPLVSSKQLEGDTWFVQQHEFALFTQQAGTLRVPAINVRFARREGYTGPASDVQVQSPALELEIRRPPGSDDIDFLITTESLDVTETWEPVPGPAKVGATFKRSIVQRAAQVPGMALAPAPDTSPEGIRVYPGGAETNDKLTRGEFLGERRETITYLVQKPGIIELPAIDHVWWNPKTEELQSKTLPAVTFEVVATTAGTAAKPLSAGNALAWLLATILILAAGIWQRLRLASWAKQYWYRLNPPDSVAARKLLRACRDNDAAAAEAAWVEWRNNRVRSFRPSPELQAALLELQRCLFGPSVATTVWRGNALAHAFKSLLGATTNDARAATADLPSLNP